MARVNLVRLEDDDVRAQEEYDSLFYELDADAKEELTQQDFCRPLQHSDFPNQPSNPNSEKLEDASHLEGTESPNQLLGTETIQPRILVLRTPLLIKSPPFPNLFPQVRPWIYLQSPKSC